MPLSVTVTKRKLKNPETGIDLSVPSYGQASAPKLVKDYHVVIITRLPHFKLPEHSEEDVIQFMIPRDYNAFEKFQKDILDAFPELKLPDLPRRFHLFMNQTHVEERQVAFDCLMKVVAKNKEVATCVPLLRFLDFSLLADREYHKRRKEYLQGKEVESKKREENLFEEGAGEVGGGLFGQGGVDTEQEEKPLLKDSGRRTQPFAAASIFDEGETESKTKRSAKISLLDQEEEEDSELFIPAEARKEAPQVGRLFETEDHSDLLNVSETLEDVLQIVNEPKSKKTASAQKGQRSSSKPASHSTGEMDLFESASNGAGVSEMGTDDIMKYIQQNQSGADDDLDLF